MCFRIAYYPTLLWAIVDKRIENDKMIEDSERVVEGEREPLLAQ
jgi:hypothetical protein